MSLRNESSSAKLRIGQVAKLFGIGEETLRYYEKEGFLAPEKNPDNGYRQYTMTDILLIADLLFYRDIGIPIADIRRILNGMEPEQITALIDEKKQKVKEELRRLQQSQIKLQRWKEFHDQSLSQINQFDVCSMPTVLIHKKALGEPKSGLPPRQFVPWPRELSFFATFSFYCDLREKPPGVFRYVALDQSIADDLYFPLNPEEYLEESADFCLFTVLKYETDSKAMLFPLIDYAQTHGLRLKGPVYGRQSIIDYSQGQMKEYYRVYAVLEK